MIYMYRVCIVQTRCERAGSGSLFVAEQSVCTANQFPPSPNDSPVPSIHSCSASAEIVLPQSTVGCRPQGPVTHNDISRAGRLFALQPVRQGGNTAQWPCVCPPCLRQQPRTCRDHQVLSVCPLFADKTTSEQLTLRTRHRSPVVQSHETLAARSDGRPGY